MTTEMKKYMDIPRLGHKTTVDYFSHIASKGLEIQIGVKLDGSNGQFEVNEKGELLVYSRNHLLDEENNLQGFYQYVTEKVDPAKIPAGFKIFGEWLVPHKIVYPKDMYRQFYLFSVYDSNNKEYISPKSDTYKQISNYIVGELGMKSEIILYEGIYQGVGHIGEILKKVTRDDEEYVNKEVESIDDVFHEGIVIKAHDYRDRYGDQLFVKVVGERFKEIKKVKYKNKSKGPDTSVEGQIVEFAVTEARVEKMLYKLVDEGILTPDFTLEDMNTIAKNLPKRIYEDVFKEEADTIADQFGEYDIKAVGKKLNGKALSLAKVIINNRIEEKLKQME
ncbi:RNA ligase [Bacillus phage G]|uniref:Gp170 n=1 Tax=Bacillus phage G TaxID=2884420 RepID=G3MBN6_9CAUD|nr:RNA ligase [Bacillus phage G]AEO93430.1 gp170 [Bacillus phage G]